MQLEQSVTDKKDISKVLTDIDEKDDFMDHEDLESLDIVSKDDQEYEDDQDLDDDDDMSFEQRWYGLD